MITQAIVLAGGLGTRLQHVIADIPKPMAEVAGKPFLTYIFDYLQSQGITKVVLAVGHRREVIINYYGDAYLNMQLMYSIEEEPLGTGGAILQAVTLLDNSPVFIINGDTFFNVDLQALYQFHLQHNALLTLSLKRMYQFDRYGTMEITDSGRITAFREKQFLEQGLINGGVYCMEKDVFAGNTQIKFSFETEILEKEAASGNIYGMEFQGYFIDIGIPQDYAKAQQDFAVNSHLHFL